MPRSGAITLSLPGEMLSRVVVKTENSRRCPHPVSWVHRCWLHQEREGTRVRHNKLSLPDRMVHVSCNCVFAIKSDKGTGLWGVRSNKESLQI